MEKLLLEACLEAMQTGAVVGIQDMGAAGLTCSTCEMGGRGGVGLEIELDLVPQRETGMTPYEIMLSESQERMLLVAERAARKKCFDVFQQVGTGRGRPSARVIGENKMRVLQHGKVVAEIPNAGADGRCAAVSPSAGAVGAAGADARSRQACRSSEQKQRLHARSSKQLLASANICSKRWVHEQYDSMVQTNTRRRVRAARLA